jgi:hypothetical protein
MAKNPHARRRRWSRPLEAAIIQRQAAEKKFGAIIVGTRRPPILMLLKLAKDTSTIEGIRRQE